MDPRFQQKGSIWTDEDLEGSKQYSEHSEQSDSDSESQNSRQLETNSHRDGEKSSEPEDSSKKMQKSARKRKSSLSSSTNGKGDESTKMSILRQEALEYRQKLGKRGVIYMSRIPKNMNPTTVRALLEIYGEITRLYLAEDEASAIAKARADERGIRKNAYFSEGWVEYADKKIAKRVAASLNNTPISNKKGSKYHDELWNLKYLRKFKWDYLTEKFAYERRTREAKIRASLMKARRDNAEFAELVEKGKGRAHAQERINKRKRESASASDEGVSTATASEAGGARMMQSKYRQNPVLEVGGSSRSTLVGSDLLGKVFRKKKSDAA